MNLKKFNWFHKLKVFKFFFIKDIKFWGKKKKKEVYLQVVPKILKEFFVF